MYNIHFFIVFSVLWKFLLVGGVILSSSEPLVVLALYCVVSCNITKFFLDF